MTVQNCWGTGTVCHVPDHGKERRSEKLGQLLKNRYYTH